MLDAAVLHKVDRELAGGDALERRAAAVLATVGAELVHGVLDLLARDWKHKQLQYQLPLVSRPNSV